MGSKKDILGAMTENGMKSELAGEGTKPKSGWRRALGAGVLSLVLPGMGQLVNRQPRKAVVLAVASEGLRLLWAHTELMFAFPTMVGMMAAAVVFQLGVAADAVYGAVKGKKEAPIPLPKVAYTVIALAIVAVLIYPPSQQTWRRKRFSAFRIASGSMCPTVCVNERVVANGNAYLEAEPQRGDVVLLKHGSSEALFVKRVIGLPGDVITQGPDGTVLVNGQTFHPPAPCGKPAWKGPSPPTCPMCATVTVKPGEYFLVGDDLGNSFDSRYEEFGAVTKDMMRGKVLFIYWSKEFSRIGCNLR